MPRDLQKPVVIELLFSQRIDPATGQFIGPTVVTNSQLSAAISATELANPGRWRKPLQHHNPANFFKDMIRTKSRNQQWPQSVLHAGYTGVEAFGTGAVFEFVPVPVGQNVAFDSAAFPMPSTSTPRHELQSVSMPLASRRLGQRNEPWLMQVAVRLHIIETHLALYSPISDIRQVDHLQMSLKHPVAEIDGLYLAIRLHGVNLEELIITCEAKGRNDDILPNQILRQVKTAFTLNGVTQHKVIPMAIKVVGSSEVFVVEFQVIDRTQIANVAALAIVSQAVYTLHPAVPGIAD